MWREMVILFASMVFLSLDPLISGTSIIIGIVCKKRSTAYVAALAWSLIYEPYFFVSKSTAPGWLSYFWLFKLATILLLVTSTFELARVVRKNKAAARERTTEENINKATPGTG